MRERSDKALPCPFCGCDDIQSYWGWPEEPWARLECSGCGATLEARDTGDNMSAVLAKWDLRVAMTVNHTVSVEINPKFEPNRVAAIVFDKLNKLQRHRRCPPDVPTFKRGD